MNPNDIFNNPQFLAGLAMMKGVPAHEAYSNAALQVQQMEKAKMMQQELQRQQYATQMLPQIASELSGLAPEEAFGKLVESGLDPREAILITEKFSRQAPKSETFTGPNNVRYNTQINQETGALEAKPIAGQLGISGGDENQIPTAAEIRINANEINKLGETARNSMRELRLLEDSEKAFEDFDKYTGQYTGPGTVVSKFAPKALENSLYNKEAQTAKQKINKLNSQLFQNRVKMLGGSATDTAKEEILKGMPSVELNPEARRDLLQTKKRENYENILRSKFFDEWYKTHNKNLAGAEDAFSSFVNSSQLMDENDNINKALLNQINQGTKETEDFGNKSTEELLAILRGK